LRSSGYKVKFIEFKKITMLFTAFFLLITVTFLFSIKPSSRKREINISWLEIIFCKAVPIAQSYIKPKMNFNFSLTKILFGFDIDKPYTIITNQIALVHAAEKFKTLHDESEAEPPTVIPSANDADEPEGKKIEETTIKTQSGGKPSAKDISIRNNTSYSIDVQKLLDEKLSFGIDNKQPQVLIFHTHASEAFTPDGKDCYLPSDPDRTEDENFNVIKVGAVMADILNKAGIKTLHDKTLHDYPSYSGSYQRSLATVQKHLKENPSIKVVLDIHRDAIITSDGAKLKVCATIDDEKTAQAMIVCGSNGGGLDHPKWRENLKLAVRIQAKMNEKYPNLARPISLVNERYNMHTSAGALLFEIGSSGNTLQEAINSGKCCADSIAQVLKEIAE